MKLLDDEIRQLEKRKQEESGPVKITLDLEAFLVFRNNYQGARGKWCTIDKQGQIRISSQVGKELTAGGIELRINKVGSMIAIRAVEHGGLKAHVYPQRSKAVVAHCKDAAKHLASCGVEFPVRFQLEWNDDLKAWIGRRVERQ